MVINEAGFLAADVLICGELIGERVVAIQAAESRADP